VGIFRGRAPSRDDPENFPPAEKGICFIAEEGDTLLMCSDGLSGVVPPSQIGQYLQDAATLDDALSMMEHDALERGSSDNITTATVVFGDRVRTVPSLRDRAVPATLAQTGKSKPLPVPAAVPSAPPLPSGPAPTPGNTPLYDAAVFPPPSVGGSASVTGARPVGEHAGPLPSAPIVTSAGSRPAPSAAPPASEPAPAAASLPAPPSPWKEPPPRIPPAAFGALITAAVTGLALIVVALTMPDARPAAAQKPTPAVATPASVVMPHQSGTPSAGVHPSPSPSPTPDANP
jgi:hypothetical protein